MLLRENLIYRYFQRENGISVTFKIDKYRFYSIYLISDIF